MSNLLNVFGVFSAICSGLVALLVYQMNETIKTSTLSLSEAIRSLDHRIERLEDVRALTKT